MPLNLFDRFLRWLAYASGIIILILMAFTVTDVVLRNVFNMPFRSIYEFTEFVLAAAVYLGIAYTGWTGGHIAVDVFSRWLDRPGWRFLNAAIAFAGAALFALIAYRAMLETLDTLSQVSNRLGWPFYPFRFTVVVGCALLAAVLLVQGVQMLRQDPAAPKAVVDDL